MFRPVRARRTWEEALDQIADAIRLGELRPGDRLPAERLLSKQMEISRPSLREATRVLLDAGVIEVRHGGGTYVRSDFIPAGLLEERSSLRSSQVTGVLEARRLIEPQVAQLAARAASAADFDALERTIELQEQSAENRERFLKLDVRFHLGIARATGNETLLEVMKLVLRRLELARDVALADSVVTDWTLAVHRRTLDAIRGGDPVEIAAVMDEHLAALERTWSEQRRVVSSPNQ